MIGKQGRRWFCYPLMLLLTLTFITLVSTALAVNPNERDVKPEANVLDPDKVNAEGGKLWVLDFKFKDPRLIKVDVPGRGQKVCWYLWYQVINNTGEPRLLVPEFELKTRDTETIHHDQILPKVQDAINALEDPNTQNQEYGDDLGGPDPGESEERHPARRHRRRHLGRREPRRQSIRHLHRGTVERPGGSRQPGRSQWAEGHSPQDAATALQAHRRPLPAEVGRDSFRRAGQVDLSRHGPQSAGTVAEIA